MTAAKARWAEGDALTLCILGNERALSEAEFEFHIAGGGPIDRSESESLIRSFIAKRGLIWAIYVDLSGRSDSSEYSGHNGRSDYTANLTS